MDDAVLGGFERLGDLTGDRQRLVQRNRATGKTLRQVVTFDQFHHERRSAAAFFEAVDVRDVGMIQGSEHFRLALKPREPSRGRPRARAAES